MIERKHYFHLSPDESDYLNQAVSIDDSLAILPHAAQGASGDVVAIQLTRVEAEQLREFLTLQLAAVGFDEDYLPNEHGQMLERLIDRFYIG